MKKVLFMVAALFFTVALNAQTAKQIDRDVKAVEKMEVKDAKEVKVAPQVKEVEIDVEKGKVKKACGDDCTKPCCAKAKNTKKKCNKSKAECAEKKAECSKSAEKACCKKGKKAEKDDVKGKSGSSL